MTQVAFGWQDCREAYVVWLDQVFPMYRKDTFSVEAVIGMFKSTHHRFRVITILKLPRAS